LSYIRREIALWVVKDKSVGVLDLAFKANTDDVRFAPAIEVVRRLIAEGAKVRASDPFAIERARLLLEHGVDFVGDPYETAQGAEALLLLAEWREYREFDWKRIHGKMGEASDLGCAQRADACKNERVWVRVL
jgi:UDPglucose 6-dehydrogenase